MWLALTAFMLLGQPVREYRLERRAGTLEAALDGGYTLASDRANRVRWYYGTPFAVDRRCWCSGFEASGWAPPLSPSAQERSVILLTPRHGLTCAHAFASPAGTQVVMLDTNGLRWTNVIASTSTGWDDLKVVTFATNWPSRVSPWRVLPPDWTNFATLSNSRAIWIRNNSGNANLYARFHYDGVSQARVSLPVAGVPFWEPGATGGDSGSPVFWLMGIQPVLAFLVHSSNIQGPFVSSPEGFAWLESQVAPDRLSTVDLKPFHRLR